MAIMVYRLLFRLRWIVYDESDFIRITESESQITVVCKSRRFSTVLE